LGDKVIGRPEEFDTLERIMGDSERFFRVREGALRSPCMLGAAARLGAAATAGTAVMKLSRALQCAEQLEQRYREDYAAVVWFLVTDSKQLRQEVCMRGMRLWLPIQAVGEFS
jgi:hypothetical protein